MMKKLLVSSLAGALMLVGASVPVNALSITPTDAVLFGNDTGQNEIDAIVFAYMVADTEELYKQDVGGAESGSLAGSYETTFSNTPTDPEDFLIEYVGGPIVEPVAYLLVKDGNQTPAWYLFNLTDLGWDGMDDIMGTGFWPDQGAVSHVTLYGGGDGGGDEVPEPTTLALFGLGLLGAGVASRRARK